MANLKIKPRRKAHQLDGGSGGNGILRLPVEILRHIVFFLPVGDAVSLSASSKTWRNVWTSLPVLNLNFDHDDDVVTLDDFVASIDNVLSTLRSRSAIIEGFSLTMNPHKEEGSKLESKLESHLDDWLSLVMKIISRRSILGFLILRTMSFYTLPQSVFTLKSLVKLQLIGCKFPPNISFADHDNDKKSRFHEFNCLREITLEDVIARDDQIQDIVDHARDFLEKLTIKTHPPLKFLSLEFFSKLDFIEVNVKTLLLNHAMNLDTVILYGIRRVYAFGIQSSHLQTLFLYEGQRFEEPIVVEIEAPKLSKVHFTGFSFPMITLLRRTQKVELHHFGHPLGGIDSSQLYRLGKFSRNVMQP
ncbi:F-box/LRR-repeat protein At3g58980-like [Prosopis cineraria]|uniref:F-box/LRR-repeat protein At3g58980-like n=1 Tax=Prosopis cineraria TaxID=364024 RepID=UPI00240F1AD9|nr:F-box/LRR-repeat protein At3g58980-like [Prosopis cineraria]